MLDRKVGTLNIARFFQALVDGSFIRPIRCARRCAKESDRRLGRLGPRDERPTRRRAADKRDEIASLHSITSSARPESGSGITIPSALAAFALMNNSSFVPC